MEVTAGRKPAQASASRAAEVRFPRDSGALSPHFCSETDSKGGGEMASAS